MRLLISLPLLLILVIFTLSNRQDVKLGFWPTGLSVDVPVSLAILVAMAVAFLIGALFTWFGAIGARRRARRAEDTARLLQAELQALKSRSAPRLAQTAPEPALTS
jgi:lipopolysaccharide assembly protein A